VHVRWLARITDTKVSRPRLVHRELVTSYTHHIFSFRQVGSDIGSAVILPTPTGLPGWAIVGADSDMATQMIYAYFE
jgi:hypothetical protein